MAVLARSSPSRFACAAVAERYNCEDFALRLTGWMRGKWQAAWWLPPKDSIGGATLAHTSWTLGQRVLKRQPEGGFAELGSSPTILSPRRSLAIFGSGSGTALRSQSVYG